jgi:uncharacterized metal-binding protein
MRQCANCGVQACCAEPGSKGYPSDCPTMEGADLIAEVEAVYEQDSETRRLLVASAQTEAAGYCRETRVEEIMSFARRIGARRLGVAHCVGLTREAALFADILKANDFEVHTLCCKVGSTPKEQVGLLDEEKVHPGQYEAVCSPVAQAKLLNHIGTQLNVLVGLCVGHDSLFFRYSEAPVTVLVAKDRVTGHNPVAALYTSHSYYRRLKG